MKNLAKLTALLLTGVMLLVLASCGAAPLAKERQAKQNILTALNDYRASNGVNAVEEISELSKAEQFWVETFRKAGDYKIPTSEFDSIYQEYQKMIPSGWEDGSCLGWDRSTFPRHVTLESTDPLDTTALMQLFAKKYGFNKDIYTAVGIGVTTIDGQMYWSCCMYDPAD